MRRCKYIPAGPAAAAGRVFFAAAPPGDKKPQLVAAKAAGDRVLVATNFTVFGEQLAVLTSAGPKLPAVKSVAAAAAARRGVRR